MPISGLILCNNEEANIERTLSNLKWLPEIVLLDSGSTDRTLEIAQTFSNVRICERSFDNHHNQWNYGLKECGIQSEWILCLDADYQVSEILAKEIQEIITSSTVLNAFWGSFEYAINGEVFKSGIYPPVQVLFRREKGTFKDEGHTQRIEVEGASGFLKNKLIHDDRKPFTRWVSSQVRYAQLEADRIRSIPQSALTRTNKVRKSTIFTPIIVFLYCLFIRGGILEGKNAILYAFQRLIAESLIQYKLKDH